MKTRWLCAAAMAAIGGASAAPAAIVVDPIPARIAPGIGVAISPFVTAPRTAEGGTAAAVQSMRPLFDRTDRLFVNDTRGVISVTNTSARSPSVYFDIRNQGVGFADLNPQAGLVSFAFHPNFNVDPDKPGYRTFYTIDTARAQGAPAPDYVGKGPVDHHNVVHEWTVADPAAPTATILASREVLRVAQPFGDHGPGTIGFNTGAAPGSADYGKLYIGLSDGGGINDPFDNAQDPNSPFGKILRIDPADPDGSGPGRYTIPADNPNAGQAGKLGEVWASGLRNPQQFSWDPLTGEMYIADIGQAQIEEVNIGRAGANYGWPAREGTFGRYADKALQFVNDDPNTGGYVDPVAQYDHDEGYGIGAALRYRGSLIPELFGQMLVSDIVNGRLFYFGLGDTSGVGGTAVLHELQLFLDGMATSMFGLEGSRGRVDLRLGMDAAGEIYLLTKQDGDIYRLTGAAVPEPATWGMMILGFGLLARRLRRRRARPSAALA